MITAALMLAATHPGVPPLPGLAGGPSAAAAGPAPVEYYVSSSTGDDANPGTSPERPWQTLARVMEHRDFAPGDAILLRRGDTWNERLRLTLRGEEGRPIRLGAYGEGPRPHIRRNGHHSEWCIILDDPWHIVVEDLTLSHAGAGLWVGGRPRDMQYDPQSVPPSGHVTIRRLVTLEMDGLYAHIGGRPHQSPNRAEGYNDGSYGIVIGDYRRTHGLTIERVRIEDCEMSRSAAGLEMRRVRDVRVHRCVFRDNTKPDHSWNSIFIAGLEQAVFERLIIDRGAHSAQFGTTAFFLANDTNVTIRGSWIINTPESSSNDRAGMSWEHSGAGYVVERCTFINNAGAAIQFLRNPGGRSDTTGIRVEGNRFVANQAAPPGHNLRGRNHSQLGQVMASSWGRNNRPEGAIVNNVFFNGPGVPRDLPLVTCGIEEQELKLKAEGNVRKESAEAVFEALPLDDPPQITQAQAEVREDGSARFRATVGLTDTDTDKRPPQVFWEQIYGPSVVAWQKNGADATCTGLVAGEYLFRLVVEDGTWLETRLVDLAVQ